MSYLISILYKLAVSLRAILYEKGLLKSHTLMHPIISVGNLTVGGTGKTPFVLYLAQILKEAGYQPIVLTRGYKGWAKNQTLLVSDGQKIFCSPEECGDEAWMLAQKLPEVPIVVGKNRYRAGRLVEDRYQKVIHILDDGYQHLQLKRNLNILFLDATDPFGGHQLLPTGRLREPLSAIRRADLIIITRAHFPLDLDEIEMNIRKHNPIVPLSYFYHDAISIADVRNGQLFRLRDFIGKRVVALAAIGNPNIFLQDLEHYQMQVLDQFLFQDHHSYVQGELDQVIRRRAQLKANAIITTEKDAVRLRRLSFGQDQIFSLQIEAKPEDPQEYKRVLLEEVESLPLAH